LCVPGRGSCLPALPCPAFFLVPENRDSSSSRGSSMNDHSDQFFEHLKRLRSRDRGALAILRRSLSFAPGAFPPAYAYVERFVGADRKATDPFRLALYLVAGLYALHPETGKNTLAVGLAELMLRRN